MKSTILVLGGDGYFGWPLSLKLAVQNPDKKILIVDNEWRRRAVRQMSSESLTPILSPQERLNAFRSIHKQDNLFYLHLDINSPDLDKLIENERPYVIYHLAQQCSAPYSMKNQEQALFTIHNNEEGNMRLLWSIRQHIPETQLIKLGSFGEYAKAGIEIAEGYFVPEYNGVKATQPMPYPRESDDIYHITKINDSNFVSMACRKWGLRITDVMQSTIFGIQTDEMEGKQELCTRFDYDEAFGTVLNRFLTQAVAGYPLTVYGTGNQSTGLMLLNDAVGSLAYLAGSRSEKGKHTVINHVTEKYSINELAATVKKLALDEGLQTKIQHGAFDPRQERPETVMAYDIDTNYLDHHIRHTPFSEAVHSILQTILKHKGRISAKVFPPLISWSDESLHVEGEEVTKSIAIPSRILKETTSTVGDENHWEKFRNDYFPYQRINLNPGTIGAPSENVKNSRAQSSEARQLESYPLGLYEEGRNSLAKIKELCNEIWPSPGYQIAVTHSTSQMINLLSLAMLRSLNKKGPGPYRIITTKHEHYGGIGVFENLPEYEVIMLDDEDFNDSNRLSAKVRGIQPHLAFFSHVCYATGQLSPVEEWTRICREVCSDCRIIVDAAQSLGLYELPFGAPDVILGSTHKWLFGPLGGGLIWMNENFTNWIEGFYWCGHYIDTDPRTEHFSIPGGQDFLIYPGIIAALELYKKVGKQTVISRSLYLAKLFRKQLHKLFTAKHIKHHFTDEGFRGDKLNYAAVVCISFPDYNPYELYSYLNHHMVHSKCIINYVWQGKKENLLRFGIPYFETIDNLNLVLNKIETYLSQASVSESVAQSA
jgi:UDP-sulfoquinovose synthase